MQKKLVATFLFASCFNFTFCNPENEAIIGLKADESSEIRHIQTQPGPRLRRAPAIHPRDKSPGILATENNKKIFIQKKCSDSTAVIAGAASGIAAYVIYAYFMRGSFF